MAGIACDSSEPNFDLAYLYDGTLEGLLSCVFEAYARHETPGDIVETQCASLRLGQETRIVDTNESHANRVRLGIVRVCGRTAFDAVKAVFLSDDEGKGAAILSFVRYAMRRGSAALRDASHPQAEAFIRLNRAVYNERHRWQQFMRFNQAEGGIYVARCNPSANVVPLLMGWFSARFNTQPFLIYDEVRDVAGVYDGRRWYLARTDEWNIPEATEHDRWVESAWKTFYDAVAVEARYNPELRRQFMPKRLWKNIAEVRDATGAPSGTLCSSVRHRPKSCG